MIVLKKLYDIVSLFLFSAVLAVCMVLPYNITVLVKEVLVICYQSIIPSLFPFMFLSQLLSRSGIAHNAGKRISFITAPIFGISKNLSGAFLIGIFGGIPNGAHAVGIMYSKGLCTKQHAERCIALSNNCSIPFLISIAGIQVLGSIKNGIVLIVSQLISIFITGLIIRFTFPSDEKIVCDSNKKTHHQTSGISSVICKSITESCLSIINVCGFITVFYIISGLISDFFRLNSPYSALIAGSFEMSSGILLVNTVPFPLSFIICSMIIGFTGISAIFQVTEAAGKYGLSAYQFVFGKIINSVIMPLTTTVLLLVLPGNTVSAFTHIIHPQYETQINVKSVALLYALVCTVVIMLLSAIYIATVCFDKKIRYHKKKDELMQKNII